MKIYKRNFSFESSDFRKMCDFLVKENSVKKEYFTWHIARLVDWKYNLHNFKKFFPANFNENTELWFSDADELIGFVLSEDFDNCFFIFLKEGYAHLYHEMIGWYRGLVSDKYDSLSTMVTENEHEYMAALENTGFSRGGHTEKTRACDTSVFKDFNFEIADVSFQSMKENKNYSEQDKLRLNAWPHKHDAELDRQIREYCRKSPVYNPEFDFVLVDSSGRHLAGCEAFIDSVNSTGEIERVCTHSDHYSKGYAQNILKACMRKLHENNIGTAFLSSWNDKTDHLYGKPGHKKEVLRYSYNLDLT